MYHAFGLRIASDIELPELHFGEPPADVEIRYRPSANPRMASWDEWLTVTPQRVSVRCEDIMFTVEAGRSILIETAFETPSNDIRVWLLGSVMAALLHQRGYLPIHANAVELDGKSAAAFAGESGCGKSTLAAWFDGRGYRVLADDLCAIASNSEGLARVFEGIPRVKLWPDALAALGRSSKGLEKVAWDLDKYHVAVSNSPTMGSLAALPLERLYLLEKAEEGRPFKIERTLGREAARGVLANAFRWELGQIIQPPRAQFDQCLALARSAGVFRIRRRWGLENFAQDCKAIERHMTTPLEEVGSR